MIKCWKQNKYILKNYFFYFIFLFIICCDRSDDIGLNIQPNSDRIILSSYSDTSMFNLSCLKEDSVKTDEVTTNMLGSYLDPLFGSVKSNIALQYRLSSIITSSFGDNVIADSVVLLLPYVGYYGDTSQNINIEVFNLGEDIFIDSSYYSNTNFSSSDILYSGSENVRPNKTVYVTGDTLPPHLRIRLDNVFFEQNLLNTDISNLSSNDNFIQHFKGLLIKPDNTAGINSSILYFNLLSEFSKIEVYYKNDSINSISNGENIKYELVSNLSSARINTFELESNLDTVSFLGVQSMGGYKLKLELQDIEMIDSLLQGKSINQAILTFYKDESNNALSMSQESLYPPHTQISLVRIGENDNIYFLDDYFRGTNYFGGTYNESDKTYSFNVSIYLQDLLSGKYLNQGLYVLPIGSSVNSNRTLFSPKVDLQIVYTEI